MKKLLAIALLLVFGLSTLAKAETHEIKLGQTATKSVRHEKRKHTHVNHAIIKPVKKTLKKGDK